MPILDKGFFLNITRLFEVLKTSSKDQFNLKRMNDTRTLIDTKSIEYDASGEIQEGKAYSSN